MIEDILIEKHKDIFFLTIKTVERETIIKLTQPELEGLKILIDEHV